MKIKFHWGTGIALFYVSFMVFMVTMVVKSTSMNVDLVEKDYYAKEVAYQGRIDQINNTNSHAAQVGVTPTAEGVKLSFPKDMKPEGTIKFFRPSEADLDFDLPISGTETLVDKPLKSGLWRIKIDWQSSGTSFYHEEVFVAP
ncbi:MAG: FixH family protein [Bacteroidota bacterium]